MLYIFDRNEEIVAVLEQGNKEACPYYGGKVRTVLNGEQTLEFSVPYEYVEAQQIKEHYSVARKNKYGQWQLFLITEIIESHGDQLELDVFAEGAFVELDNNFIEYQFHDRKQSGVVLPALLASTRWEVGTVEGTGVHDITVKNKSVLEALQTFKERWQVELTFYIEISGQHISKRKVDCHILKGAWKGKRFEYEKDLVEVERTVDAKGVKTAVYGIGPEIENSNGLRMTFKDYVWVKGVDGAPVDKPAGQSWVGDDAAKEIWGKPLKAGSSEKQHLYGKYEGNEALDPSDLLWEAYVYLQTIKDPKVTYRTKVVDLYSILGIEVESVDIGDTAAVLDRDLNLAIQARIIEYIEDLDNEENDELVLGNFKPVFSDFNFTVENLDVNALRKGDPINPSWIDTAFGFANDAITAGGGTVIITEGEGILIVDNPENPQQAIKLNAGQIALANSRNVQTNIYNWRNFGTGGGWLADLVEAGFIRFERSQGGILTLGGPDNGNGQMMVFDDKGNIVADLDALKGGFSKLYVGEFLADNVLNSNDKTIVYSVHPDTGNDNNDGLTSATALKTVQEAVNRIPKHNNGRVEIYCKNVVFNEYEIHIEGFFGSGTIALYGSGAQHNGMLYIRQNVQKIELYNVFINQIYGTQYLRDGTVTIQRSNSVYMKDVQVYSRLNVDFSVKVQNAHATIESCNFYDATTAGVHADTGGIVDLLGDNYGSGAWSGLRALGTGRIAVHNNTAPKGTINTEKVNGGEIVGTVTAYAEGTRSVLASPPITALFSHTAARSWNAKTGKWNTNNNFIYQGEFSTRKTNSFGQFYTEYNGNWKGCFWFNNSDIIAKASGKTLVSARLKIRRLSYGGYSGSYLAELWTTPTPITQAGTEVQPVADFKIGGGTIFRWGEEDYIEIPTWVITAFINGSYNGFMLYVANGTNYMIFDDFAQLEITYK